MSVVTRQLKLETKGDCDIHDITSAIQAELKATKLTAGIVTVFVPGSTAGVTTVEYEPGLVKDLKRFFEKIAPQDERYAHEDTWHDGNGHSHVRSSLLKPSLTIPFVNRELILGTWQQCIVIDFDNKPRQRNVVFQFIGE